MRFSHLLGAALSLSGLLSGVLAESSAQDPTVLASASFPEDNTFNHVTNGQRNSLVISVENKSGQNATLINVAGSLMHPVTNKLVKNLTAVKYDIPLVGDKKMQVPFHFYSEQKPGEYRLLAWVEHSTSDGKKYRVDAYESVVSVVEPEFSIFDIKLILTYLITAALLGGAGYLVYDAYAPMPVKSKRTQPVVSAPVAVTASGTGGYEEEWIPEHHLKKSKKGNKTSGGATSGDESAVSGAETSGTEGLRRSARKGKKN